MTSLILFLIAASPGIFVIIREPFRHRAWVRRQRQANAAFQAWIDARAERPR